MGAFKEQIETLRNELADEKTKHRDTKRTSDEKVRQFQQEVRDAKQITDEKKKLCSDMEGKVSDLEDKWNKSKRINKQKQDKIDSLENELESSKASGSSSSAEMSTLKTKLKDAEKNIDTKDVKIKDLEKELATSKKAATTSSATNGSSAALKTENEKLKKEIEELKSKSGSGSSSYAASKEIRDLKAAISKHELSEEQLVISKAKLTTEKEELEGEHQNVLKEYGTIKGELSALRQTYNNKADEWIKEKLDLQHRMKDLQDSLISLAGEGWESERDRFKQIIEDRDSQITQLKIEGDVGRSQLVGTKKEIDELKLKLQDYEKMSRFQKAAVSDSSASAELETKLSDAKKQLSTIERDHRSEMNNVKMKYDGKVAVMNEEIASLKAQSSKYRREREHYKEVAESAQKNKRPTSGGSEETELKSKISDLTYQIHALEDELSESKLVASKASAQAMAQKSTYEIQVAELNSKLNEAEEEALIDSGRARIAGTRTKMELAWQKERESQKKLINELNTMARDLKATLLEVEKERDRERLDAKRKLQGMKGAFDEEQDDTKKQITDLQYDLLELRDAHAKLRTTNEKLRRDKDKSVDDVRLASKTRSDYGEEKKIQRLISDMDEFLGVLPKFLGSDIMEK